MCDWQGPWLLKARSKDRRLTTSGVFLRNLSRTNNIEHITLKITYALSNLTFWKTVEAQKAEVICTISQSVVDRTEVESRCPESQSRTFCLYRLCYQSQGPQDILLHIRSGNRRDKKFSCSSAFSLNERSHDSLRHPPVPFPLYPNSVVNCGKRWQILSKMWPLASFREPFWNSEMFSMWTEWGRRGRRKKCEYSGEFLNYKSYQARWGNNE